MVHPEIHARPLYVEYPESYPLAAVWLYCGKVL